MKIKHILKEYNKRFSDEELKYAVDIIMDSVYYKHNKENILDGKHLYHGTDNIPADISHKVIKDRERSRDTADYIHNTVNEMTKQKFGVKIRNKFFVSTGLPTASTYGEDIHVVIPIGDYNIYISETIDDMYTNRNDILKLESLNKTLYIEIFKSLKDSNSERKEAINNYLKTNINELLSNVNNFDDINVMFNIDNYTNILSSNKKKFDYSYLLIAEKIAMAVFNHVFEDNINYDNDNYDITKFMRILTRLVRDIMDNHKEKFIELIQNNINERLKENYVDTLKETKNIKNIDPSFECMVDMHEALFIDSEYKNEIISEIERRITNDN